MSSQESSPLLRSRRFLPYFITQAMGAFNDNIFKNVLLLLVAYATLEQQPISSTLYINMAAGLFILPFFIFSASAGVLADRHEKSALIRKIKLAEIVIMSIAAFAFISQSYWLLLFLLFLMGSQSAIFGPIKYAILPQHLQQSELVQGNALVETGTFLAILLGTLGAGIIASSLYSSYIVAVLCVLFAIIGYISSLFIPTATSDKIAEKVSFNPILHTKNTLKIAHSDNLIFLSIMGISWFWFLGASYLTQFPNFTKMHLHGSEGAVSILLALFSIGIAIGSLLCNKISKGKLEPGIVPLGSIGITIFGANLYWFTPEQTSGMLNAAQFITSIELLPLFISLLLLGVSGGIYIVPLYTMIQQRARTDQRAQVIAANNIYNAIFMVVSAVLAIVFLHQLQLSIPLFFGALALGNIVIAGFLFYQTPTFNERLFTLLKMKS